VGCCWKPRAKTLTEDASWWRLGCSLQTERLITSHELAKYHSDNPERIMLAVLGQVFDVSSKPSIYGAWAALPP
jgi:hypothetical protein